MRTHERVPGLDGLRAAAAMIVFVGHSPLPWHVNGGLAVATFFFLSGYLITTLLIREHATTGRVDLVAFYLRRTFRIIPPMVAAVLLAVLLDRLGAIDDSWTLRGIVESLTFISNYVVALQPPATGLINSVPLWSLCIEEHYYLLFPVVFLLLARRLSSDRARGVALICLIVMLEVWKAWLLFVVQPGGQYVYLASETNMSMIVAGAAFAFLRSSLENHSRIELGVGRLWPVAVMGLVLAANYGQAPVLGVLRAPAEMLAFVVVFTAAMSGGLRRPLESTPTRWLGGISYAFYLVHVITLDALGQLISDPWARTAAAFAVTCALSVAIRHLVERPSRALHRCLKARRHPARIPALVPAGHR
jgi:peptidoglycan/LPS O-acetylase OafA/YrhL